MNKYNVPQVTRVLIGKSSLYLVDNYICHIVIGRILTKKREKFHIDANAITKETHLYSKMYMF